MVCYCDDCQTYAYFLERAKEILDGNGGTEVFPVVPSALTFTGGKEHLRCVRLSPRGMYRWYAGCCRTPIANTMASPRIPYAGVVHEILGDGDLGPVRARVQGRFAIGTPSPDTHRTVTPGIIARVLRFLLVAWLRGGRRPSPFFDSQTGKPVAEPRVLTLAERDELRKNCGPRPGTV